MKEIAGLVHAVSGSHDGPGDRLSGSGNAPRRCERPVTDEIDEPVFRIDPTRPESGQLVTQWFRTPDSFEG